MHTTTSETGFAEQLPFTLKAKRGKIGPLALIVVVHLILFYMLQSGLLRHAVSAALPEVLNITFIAPPAPPAPPKPSAPEPPKTVRVAHRAPARVSPPTSPEPATAEPAIAAAQAQVSDAAPAAPAAPAPEPVPVTPRTVSSAEYIRAPQPVYPAISRRLGESGTVVLRILISEKGLAEQVIVQKSSGFANLDEAGRQAALRALFKPLLVDGKPVSVFVIVPLNFELS